MCEHSFPGDNFTNWEECSPRTAVHVGESRISMELFCRGDHERRAIRHEPPINVSRTVERTQLNGGAG